MTFAAAAHGGGLVRDLGELLDIENLGALHGVLDLGAFVGWGIRVKDAHLARVHAQLHAGRGGRVDLAFFDRSLYFVVVGERGKGARLEDSDLQTGFVHVDLFALGVKGVWFDPYSVPCPDYEYRRRQLCESHWLPTLCRTLGLRSRTKCRERLP